MQIRARALLPDCMVSGLIKRKNLEVYFGRMVAHQGMCVGIQDFVMLYVVKVEHLKLF